MKPVLATLVDLIERDGIAALITVVAARGSTPREAGARMLVTKAGAISGTIGGGRLEMEAIEAASSLIAAARDTAALRRFALGPALGQCCGGHVTLALEAITAARLPAFRALAEAEAAGGVETEGVLHEGAAFERSLVGPITREPTAIFDGEILREVFGRTNRPVYLFGAGHVGRAVVLALANLPFAVTWVDERADMFPSAVPSGTRLIATDCPAAVAASAEPGCLALVMTHDHGIDLDIVHAALVSGHFAEVGLIGSATKRARFESRLKALGLDPAVATSFKCPIGVPGIRSKEPAVIAASVAASLLITDECLRAGQRAPETPLLKSVAAEKMVKSDDGVGEKSARKSRRSVL